MTLSQSLTWREWMWWSDRMSERGLTIAHTLFCIRFHLHITWAKHFCYCIKLDSISDFTVNQRKSTVLWNKISGKPRKDFVYKPANIFWSRREKRKRVIARKSNSLNDVLSRSLSSWKSFLVSCQKTFFWLVKNLIYLFVF